ncbi:hypothetical protein CP8484711_0493A, partial [Chlamydia psittaci 84-8471/1]
MRVVFHGEVESLADFSWSISEEVF